MTSSERNPATRAEGPGHEPPEEAGERCLVLHPAFRHGPPTARDSDARLNEAIGLAEAIALTVVDSRARREQLLLLLTAEGVLREDSFYRGLDLQLVWQG